VEYERNGEWAAVLRFNRSYDAHDVLKGQRPAPYQPRPDAPGRALLLTGAVGLSYGWKKLRGL
jgi:hypothetical protein